MAAELTDKEREIFTPVFQTNMAAYMAVPDGDFKTKLMEMGAKFKSGDEE